MCDVYDTSNCDRVPGCFLPSFSPCGDESRAVPRYPIAEATAHGDASRSTSPRCGLRSPRRHELPESPARADVARPAEYHLAHQFSLRLTRNPGLEKSGGDPSATAPVVLMPKPPPWAFLRGFLSMRGLFNAGGSRSITLKPLLPILRPAPQYRRS